MKKRSTEVGQQRAEGKSLLQKRLSVHRLKYST